MASTKKGLTARVAAGFGAVALATLTALGGALPASAVPVDPTPGATGSITIHKHEQPAVPGQPGTGSANDPVSGAAIRGVDFTIQRVTSFDVLDNDDWALLSPTRAGGALDVAEVLADPVAHPVAPLTDTANAFEVTTGIDGTVTQTLPLGIYLVTEVDWVTAAGIVIPAKPFLVVVPQAVADGSWNYNVHVFPKNTVTDVIKSAEAFDQEGLGANVTWTLDIVVPIPAQPADLVSFQIKDPLAAGVEFDASATPTPVRITVGTTPLVRGTDFDFALSATNELTITLTQDGIDVLLANPTARIAAQIDTTITDHGAGTVTNVAHVLVNGESVSSEAALTYWGGVEFTKVDDEGQPLSGATFQVLDDMGAVVSINGETEFVSDRAGSVVIDGLRTNDAGDARYTIKEIEAPAGYQLGITTEWDVEVPIGTNAALEIAAPIVNAQIPPYALPITGGSGQAAFMIGGAGLILGALGFALLRRRKAQAAA